MQCLVGGIGDIGGGAARRPGEQILGGRRLILVRLGEDRPAIGLFDRHGRIAQAEAPVGLDLGVAHQGDSRQLAILNHDDDPLRRADGMELIAVILGGENSKQRFQDATKLLNYGFGKCQVYEDNDPPKLKPVEVQGGVKEQILCEYADTFRYLDTSGANLAGVTKKTQMKQSVKAPVKKGQKVGELVYKLGEKEIGRVEILAKESCKKAEFLDYLKKVMQKIRV